MRQAMATANLPNDSITRMRQLLESISPLPRMVNSPGLDECFKIIAADLPGLIVHEYPAGMECEDWIVPRSWEVKKGSLMDSKGKVIASTDECLLFVAPYSEPVDGWFTKAEIEQHLSTRKDRPDAFPLEHRHAYNFRLKTWGITFPYRRWTELPEGRYHVQIDVEFGQGSMKVGEYFLEGRRPETICICAHIDELCNDDLSGCIVGMELMRIIESLPNRKYSYQLLLVPEMFGSLFYIYENPDKIARTVGMLNLETVGASGEWLLKKALRDGDRLEEILRAALRLATKEFKEDDFFGGYGNDERVYSWPSIGIPGVALQKHPFPEYHTSEDVPGIVKDEHLLKAVEICANFVRILEDDYVPAYTKRLQPWLTRRNLYFDSIRDIQRFRKFNNSVLFGIDGVRSVLDLAISAGLEFDEVREYLKSFQREGLLSSSDVIWSARLRKQEHQP